MDGLPKLYRMGIPHTLEWLDAAMEHYGNYSTLCEKEIYPLPLESRAEHLSCLASLYEAPYGYMHPVEDADSLVYLLGHTPSSVRFSVRPRLLAKKNISGIDLNRLSDFDIYLLDASSPRRVEHDISRTVMPADADLRNVNLAGLSARKTDFSKAKLSAAQLLQLNDITNAKIPPNMPLADLGGRLAMLAPALNTLELHEKNIAGCDLSCTSYPLGKLFKNCSVFKGVSFPPSEWSPYEFDDRGMPGPLLYSMAGCTFVGCDLRGISGLTQSEIDEASFFQCLLPNGLRGRNLEREFDRREPPMPAR